MKNFAELDAKVCSCTKALTAKMDGSNGKRAILLCGGTGCISSNSMEIKSKFEALVAANGLEEKISVNIVGCFGFCSQGPFVKIFPEDTLYRLVTLDDVEEIFEKDIKGGQIIDKFSEILGIKPGETTKDGLFTLDALRCIGACGIAPAVTINGKVYPKMTVDAVQGVVNEYLAKEGK